MNLLRAFDGELDGKRLHFAIGKAPRAYVYEWSDPHEFIEWKVRLDDPATFEVAVRYTTGLARGRGSYTVSIGDQVPKPPSSLRQMISQ